MRNNTQLRNEYIETIAEGPDDKCGLHHLSGSEGRRFLRSGFEREANVELYASTTSHLSHAMSSIHDV